MISTLGKKLQMYIFHTLKLIPDGTKSGIEGAGIKLHAHRKTIEVSGLRFSKGGCLLGFKVERNPNREAGYVGSYETKNCRFRKEK